MTILATARLRRHLLAGAVGLLFAAACGSGDDTASSTRPSTTAASPTSSTSVGTSTTTVARPTTSARRSSPAPTSSAPPAGSSRSETQAVPAGDPPATPSAPGPPPSRPRPNTPDPPAPSGFRVVEALLHPDPADYTGPCTNGLTRITFRGRIGVAGGSGVVSYRFVRDDGGADAVRTLSFAGPGTQDVQTTWDTGLPGWVEIEILDPAPLRSNRATFSVTCT